MRGCVNNQPLPIQLKKFYPRSHYSVFFSSTYYLITTNSRNSKFLWSVELITKFSLIALILTTEKGKEERNQFLSTKLLYSVQFLIHPYVLLLKNYGYQNYSYLVSDLGGSKQPGTRVLTIFLQIIVTYLYAKRNFLFIKLGIGIQVSLGKKNSESSFSIELSQKIIYVELFLILKSPFEYICR